MSISTSSRYPKNQNEITGAQNFCLQMDSKAHNFQQLACLLLILIYTVSKSVCFYITTVAIYISSKITYKQGLFQVTDQATYFRGVFIFYNLIWN